MPTAPYLPVAAAPKDDSTPSLRLDTPGAAFGGATADALSHLGKVSAGVGDELYARAKAIQDLENDVAAKNADAELMRQTGELRVNFGLKLGRDANPQAYQEYIKQLEDITTNIGGSLPNDMAKKMFKATARQTVGRAIISGSQHAVTEQKRSLVASSDARLKGFEDQALSAPNDDIAFRNWVNESIVELNEQRNVTGWTDDELNHKINERQSKLWVSRLWGMAQGQPFKAKELFDANRDKILGQDQEKISKVITDKLHTVGGRNISSAVNQGFAPYMKQEHIDRTQGVESALIQVVKRAQQISEVPFTIGGQGGRRTPEQQAALVRAGRSQTLNSDHLGGRAIDLVPLIDGKENYKDHTGYDKIAQAMAKASDELGIPLQPKSKAFTGWDPAHYSLGTGYDVGTAPKEKEPSLADRVARAKDYAKKLAPEDSVFADYVGERVMTDFTRGKAIQRDADVTNINTINGAIIGAAGSGKLPTTIEELKATSPEVGAAWDALDETKQRRFLGYLARNAKGETGWTQEGLKRWQAIKGQAYTDPAEFMSVDVLNENIPNSAKRELVNLQMKLKDKAEGDPRVGKALQVLGPDMRNAGITKQQDADRYYQFVGTLQDALTEWQGETKKTPKAEDIKAIGAQLLQEQATPWFGIPFLPGKTPMYRIPVPDKDKEEIKADTAWTRLGITPTDEQIQRVYTRRQYQKLYGGTAKPAVDQPQVPRR